jgi:hypothetical protein
VIHTKLRNTQNSGRETNLRIAEIALNLSQIIIQYISHHKPASNPIESSRSANHTHQLPQIYPVLLFPFSCSIPFHPSHSHRQSSTIRPIVQSTHNKIFSSFFLFRCLRRSARRVPYRNKHNTCTSNNKHKKGKKQCPQNSLFCYRTFLFFAKIAFAVQVIKTNFFFWFTNAA